MKKHQLMDKNKERLPQVTSKFLISMVGLIIMVNRLLLYPLDVPRLRLYSFFEAVATLMQRRKDKKKTHEGRASRSILHSNVSVNKRNHTSGTKPYTKRRVISFICAAKVTQRR